MDRDSSNLESAFHNLLSQYNDVGSRIFSQTDFNDDDLESSRGLFDDPESSRDDLRPKELDVVALVSGLPFSHRTISFLTGMQTQIDSMIGDAKRYWVKPQNLAVEYCVFKWPDQPFNPTIIDHARALCSEIDYPPFNLLFGQVQIHPDGCVVMQGFDEHYSIQHIRADLLRKSDDVPRRQSNWAHVPLGRILDPVGQPSFEALKHFCSEQNAGAAHSEFISNAYLLHESRWYMEEKHIIKTINFEGRS